MKYVRYIFVLPMLYMHAYCQISDASSSDRTESSKAKKMHYRLMLESSLLVNRRTESMDRGNVFGAVTSTPTLGQLHGFSFAFKERRWPLYITFELYYGRHKQNFAYIVATDASLTGQSTQRFDFGPITIGEINTFGPAVGLLFESKPIKRFGFIASMAASYNSTFMPVDIATYSFGTSEPASYSAITFTAQTPGGLHAKSVGLRGKVGAQYRLSHGNALQLSAGFYYDFNPFRSGLMITEGAQVIPNETEMDLRYSGGSFSLGYVFYPKRQRQAFIDARKARQAAKGASN